jgi:hypothetical protein
MHVVARTRIIMQCRLTIKVVAGAVKRRSEPEGDGWRLLINQFSVVQPQPSYVVHMAMLIVLTGLSLDEILQDYAVYTVDVR